MKSQGILIAIQRERCHVARLVGEQVEVCCVQATAQDSPEEQALSTIDEAVSVLKKWNALDQCVCLGLPSEMVFSAQVDTGGLPRKDRAVAMTYRLEEKLPLEAERITTDFLPTSAGASLGVAVETARTKAIVDRLTELGVEVTAICPTALLTLWQALQGRDTPADYAFVTDEGHVDIFRLASRCPAAWLTTSSAPADLVDCLHAELLANPSAEGRPKAMLVGKLADNAEAAARTDVGLEIDNLGDQPPIELAARAAGQLLAGQQAGWVDLRRDAMALPNPWRRLTGLVRCAVVLGLAALAATVGTFYWQALAYEGLAGDLDNQQVAQFHRVFPNYRRPPNVHSRLRSELALLSGVSGTGYALPARASALDTLRRVTDNLPPAIRLRITDIQLDPAGIVLEGQTRSHSDAELVARTLKQGNFEVDPPRTERLVAGGVAFTIIARLAKPKPSAKPRPAPTKATTPEAPTTPTPAAKGVNASKPAPPAPEKGANR